MEFVFEVSINVYKVKEEWLCFREGYLTQKIKVKIIQHNNFGRIILLN